MESPLPDPRDLKVDSRHSRALTAGLAVLRRCGRPLVAWTAGTLPVSCWAVECHCRPPPSLPWAAASVSTALGVRSDAFSGRLLRGLS